MVAGSFTVFLEPHKRNGVRVIVLHECLPARPAGALDPGSHTPGGLFAEDRRTGLDLPMAFTGDVDKRRTSQTRRLRNDVTKNSPMVTGVNGVRCFLLTVIRQDLLFDHRLVTRSVAATFEARIDRSEASTPFCRVTSLVETGGR